MAPFFFQKGCAANIHNTFSKNTFLTVVTMATFTVTGAVNEAFNGTYEKCRDRYKHTNKKKKYEIKLRIGSTNIWEIRTAKSVYAHSEPCTTSIGPIPPLRWTEVDVAESRIEVKKDKVEPYVTSGVSMKQLAETGRERLSKKIKKGNVGQSTVSLGSFVEPSTEAASSFEPAKAGASPDSAPADVRHSSVSVRSFPDEEPDTEEETIMEEEDSGRQCTVPEPHLEADLEAGIEADPEADLEADPEAYPEPYSAGDEEDDRETRPEGGEEARPSERASVSVASAPFDPFALIGLKKMAPSLLRPPEAAVPYDQLPLFKQRDPAHFTEEQKKRGDHFYGCPVLEFHDLRRFMQGGLKTCVENIRFELQYTKDDVPTFMDHLKQRLLRVNRDTYEKEGEDTSFYPQNILSILKINDKTLTRILKNVGVLYVEQPRQKRAKESAPKFANMVPTCDVSHLFGRKP